MITHNELADKIRTILAEAVAAAIAPLAERLAAPRRRTRWHGPPRKWSSRPRWPRVRRATTMVTDDPATGAAFAYTIDHQPCLAGGQRHWAKPSCSQTPRIGTRRKW